MQISTSEVLCEELQELLGTTQTTKDSEASMRATYERQAIDCMNNWITQSKLIKWNEIAGDESLPEGPIQVATDAIKLINAPIQKIYQSLERRPSSYGKLLLMSRQYIGSLMSESFCERCFSAANLVVNPHSTRSNPETVSIKVISRMNRVLLDSLHDSVHVHQEMRLLDREESKANDDGLSARYGDDFYGEEFIEED